jgi:hypothetical protein
MPFGHRSAPRYQGRLNINMAKLFKTYLKKLFSDLHSAIISIIVGAMILGLGGIWAFSERL